MFPQHQVYSWVGCRCSLELHHKVDFLGNKPKRWPWCQGDQIHWSYFEAHKSRHHFLDQIDHHRLMPSNLAQKGDQDYDRSLKECLVSVVLESQTEWQLLVCSTKKKKKRIISRDITFSKDPIELFSLSHHRHNLCFQAKLGKFGRKRVQEFGVH